MESLFSGVLPVLFLSSHFAILKIYFFLQLEWINYKACSFAENKRQVFAPFEAFFGDKIFVGNSGCFYTK